MLHKRQLMKQGRHAEKTHLIASADWKARVKYSTSGANGAWSGDDMGCHASWPGGKYWSLVLGKAGRPSSGLGALKISWRRRPWRKKYGRAFYHCFNYLVYFGNRNSTYSMFSLRVQALFTPLALFPHLFLGKLGIINDTSEHVGIAGAFHADSGDCVYHAQSDPPCSPSPTYLPSATL